MDQIAHALARYAADRFTDMRIEVLERLKMPEFDLVLRGYDVLIVSALVRQCLDALRGGNMCGRFNAQSAIRYASLRIVGLGYDRVQVNAYLQELSRALAVTEQD